MPDLKPDSSVELPAKAPVSQPQAPVKPAKRKCLLTNALFPVAAWFIFTLVYYLNFNTINQGMSEFGGDVNRAHAEVVKKMQQNAYEYEDSNTFAKYGNILENKDCDGSNPHRVNKEVFWKAMKKSYKYQNNK